MEHNKTTKTALGLDENIAGLLCYVLGFITGIVFLVLEKENKFVRFHAMQSIIVFGGLFVLNLIAGIVVGIVASVLFIVPNIGWTVGWIVGMLAYLIYSLIFLVAVILWILLMLKAYQGERFKLPIVGDFAEKQISK